MKHHRLSRPPLLNQQTGWGLIFLAAISLSLYQAGIFQQDIVNPGGFPLLWRFLKASIQPDLSPEFLRLTLDATLTTLAYAVCGTFLSVLLGIVGGVLTSEVWWLAVFPRHFRYQPSGIQLGLRTALAVPRAIHELLWGLFFVNIWGLDPLVAILAIAIPFGAVVAKVFSEILDETPRQPLIALLNSGVAPLTAFLYTLIPQAFLNLLSYTFYRFECSIRSAAVLGIIGAGGLGYEILLSLQSLRYQQLWTFFYALIILNGIVDFGSAGLRDRLGCTSRLDLNARKSSNTVRLNSPSGEDGLGLPSRPTSPLKSQVYKRDTLVSFVSVAVLLLIPFCFWYVHPDVSKLWSPRTWTLLVDAVQVSIPPDISGEQFPKLLILSMQTLSMSVLAIALAGIGGILLSFPAAYNFFLPGGLLNPSFQDKSNSMGAWLSFLATRIVLLFCRAIPAPIWALVVLFILFPGILPGAIALGLHNLGILGRLMAEVTENLPQPPLQALKAQGAPAALVFLYGVLPMTLPRFLAYILYRWEVCMRETVIVGLVGAGGLGRLLNEQLSSFDSQGVLTSLGCLVILTFLVDWVSSVMRQALR
ncbi:MULTISPECIES: PhnE/PtxC family ABC transporter permease [unclassified Coleofasciculus]|uniref:PhnE/PtxC family ABC transporter permease n=1 Tax=unclassified Coleofasciculus TaxID=2692782 RepID=UPI00187F4B94|nr:MULTISPECIES: ABC transporter permease subunit [unclassified Coleofasciculus]MBE9126355.1 ABC transporter permease subunit [Coleofasciculus sp. LEGE 07081]MBE9150008.1 ABC transporter permease subunit [Coleofasciculus sp. LEGE 07092]